MISRWITPRLLVLIGVIAFAVALAAWLSSLLVGDASLVALGMALGIILGVPIGLGSYWLGFRRGQSAAAEQRPLVTLTPEQSDILLRALERQQTSPAAFGLATRQPRQITPVGGVDLSAITGEPPENTQP